jgi:hypothetical protein
MIRKITLFIIVLALALLPLQALGVANDSAQDLPVYRALLIACDDFVSYPDTFPSSHNNLTMMRDMLSRDTRGIFVHWQDGITQNANALEAAITVSLKGAAERDVSYIYISTHGILIDAEDDGERSGFGLVLSDGFEEEIISCDKLKEILDKVCGTKIIIADACYSGSLAETFAEPDYIVLASSRGDEKSWYWNAEQGKPADFSSSSLEPASIVPSGAARTTLGESYYTQALATGAGRFGEFSSDANQNGSITLDELSGYLMTAHAASEAMIYAGADAAGDFVFIQYDVNSAGTADRTLLTDFDFGDMTLSTDNRSFSFSFTANESVRVGYQYVTFSEDINQWDWESAAMWLDSELTGGADAAVQNGRIYRTVTLNGISKQDSGNIMMSVVAFDEYGHPTICASRIITVQNLI